jgi:hypothetical protein
MTRPRGSALYPVLMSTMQKGRRASRPPRRSNSATYGPTCRPVDKLVGGRGAGQPFAVARRLYGQDTRCVDPAEDVQGGGRGLS